MNFIYLREPGLQLLNAARLAEKRLLLKRWEVQMVAGRAVRVMVPQVRTARILTGDESFVPCLDLYSHRTIELQRYAQSVAMWLPLSKAYSIFKAHLRDVHLRYDWPSAKPDLWESIDLLKEAGVYDKSARRHEIKAQAKRLVDEMDERIVRPGTLTFYSPPMAADVESRKVFTWGYHPLLWLFVDHIVNGDIDTGGRHG